MIALIDPAIAEIIQDQRLIRKKLQRVFEVGFGLRPLLAALIGDAAEIIERPIGGLGLLGCRERARIADDGLVVMLMRALQIAERRQELPRRMDDR